MTRPPRSAWLIGCGLVAWLGASFVLLDAVPRQQRQLAAVEALASSARALASRQRAAPERPLAQPATADGFAAGFPDRATRPLRVEALLINARRHGVGWSRSDFRVGGDAAPGLVRYQMTMPATGSYAGLRRLIADALQADPALALDRIRLRRANADSAPLEAELQWSFYSRESERVAEAAGRRGLTSTLGLVARVVP